MNTIICKTFKLSTQCAKDCANTGALGLTSVFTQLKPFFIIRALIFFL